MAARTTMAGLITYLRRLVADPAGASQIWSDDDLEDVLDNRRTDVFQAELEGQATIGSGGTVTYKNYYAGVQWWEDGETLQSGAFATLTETSSNHNRGHWEFSAGQVQPVYITGSYYDMYGAAVDVLDLWMASEKLNYDFSADGGSYKRSQRTTQLMALRNQYAGMAAPVTAQMYTGDPRI